MPAEGFIIKNWIKRKVRDNPALAHITQYSEALELGFPYFLKHVVYSYTSTVGGCFDEEFEKWLVALFEEFKAGEKLLMLSDLTLQELEHAPIEVREKLSEVSNKYRVQIETTDKAIELAEIYINEGALTNKSYNDALHITLATLNNASVLASWN